MLMPLLNTESPSAFHSFFVGLRNFLSPIDVIDQFDKFNAINAAGGTYFLIFAFMMGLILINILIAMMNDSYLKVNETERITFRVGTLRQAITLFRGFPLILTLKERIMRGDVTQVVKCSFNARPDIQFSSLRCEVKIVEDVPPTVDERLDSIERQVKAVHSTLEQCWVNYY